MEQTATSANPSSLCLHFAMINGRNDYLCNPLESQVPMFRLLGTPPEHKRHIVMDGGHVPTQLPEVYRQAISWLDTYLGPVRQ